MVTEQARGLALRLLASYPGWPVSEMSVIAISEALDRMGLDIAEPVVERVRSEQLKPPSIAELYEVARQVRRESEERERPALTPGQFVEQMPPEVLEKWRALQAKWAREEAS